MFVVVIFMMVMMMMKIGHEMGILLTVTNVRGRKSMLITVKIRILSP